MESAHHFAGRFPPRRLRSRRAGRLAVVAGAALVLVGGFHGAVADPADAAEPFTVYLDPDGSDSADGDSPDTAVATLDRAQDVLDDAEPDGDVEVRIAQGVYVAPTTTWTFYVTGHSVSFLPIDYEDGDDVDDIDGRPVFRGDGSEGYWLSARPPGDDFDGDADLDFRYLQIERYSSGGLQFHGGVEIDDGMTVPAGEGVNNNVVYGMEFRELGSKHVPAGTGYGGLNTWNSSGNEVRNNHFVQNENDASEAGLIHGIYLAHHSSENVIASNRFDTISGGPMRTRNDSNDNDIYHNTFTLAGVGAYYSEWFCDDDCLDDNPDHGRECASHGNFFYENELVSGYDGGDLSVWALTPDGVDYPGGAGCDNEGQPRVRTADNG